VTGKVNNDSAADPLDEILELLKASKTIVVSDEEMADFLSHLESAFERLGSIPEAEFISLLDRLYAVVITARRMQRISNAAKCSTRQLRRAAMRVTWASTHVLNCIRSLENASKTFLHSDVLDIKPLSFSSIQKQLRSMTKSLDETVAVYIGLIAPDLRTGRERKILQGHRRAPRLDVTGLKSKADLQEWIIGQTERALHNLRSNQVTDADIARFATATIGYALSVRVKDSAVTQRLRRSRMAPRIVLTPPLL
jgi:hypothetical protein